MKNKILGIIFCAVCSVPAWILGKKFTVVGGAVFGILIGMILTIFIKDKGFIDSGIKFTSKKILQYAVILLGFGLNMSAIVKSGQESLPIIVSTISIALIIAFVLNKILKIDSKTATLIGVGSSICGGSAIAATAPVIDADDKEIAQAISVIFLFNVIAAVIFPSLGSFLGMSDYGFGIFAGTAVNDTSSVTAAASAWDGIHNSNTLDVATIVKLTRTLAIIPITAVLSIYYNKKNHNHEKKIHPLNIFPRFILYFLLAAIITSVFDLPHDLIIHLKTLSKFFITMAMVAIGMNTHIIKLIKTGVKPIFMGFCCWIGITGMSILLQKILGLF